MYAEVPDRALSRTFEAPTVEDLEAALVTSRVVSTAVGILMARYGISNDTAFAHLKRVSQESNRKLRDIAAEMVNAADRRAKARQGDETTSRRAAQVNRRASGTSSPR